MFVNNIYFSQSLCCPHVQLQYPACKTAGFFLSWGYSNERAALISKALLPTEQLLRKNRTKFLERAKTDCGERKNTETQKDAESQAVVITE